MDKAQTYKEMKQFFTRSETVSTLCIVLFLALALSIIFVSPQLYQRSMHEGDVALKDTYAPYDFNYLWGTDEDRTRKKTEGAVAKVPYTMQRNIALEKKAVSDVKNFLDVLAEEKNIVEGESDVLAGVKESTGTKLSSRDLNALLAYPDTTELRKSAAGAVSYVFTVGYISTGDLVGLREKKVEKVTIVNRESGEEYTRSVESLIDDDKIRNAAEKAVAQGLADGGIRQAVSALVVENVKPNLVPDGEDTEARKGEVAKKTEPVPGRWTVKKNELIIEKGKRVNARHIAQMAYLRRVFTQSVTTTFFFGVLLLFLLLGAIAAVHMSFMRRTNFLKDTKSIAIALLSMLLMIIVSDFVMDSPQPSYFIPLASLGMLIMLLVGFDLAFICVVLMSVLVSMIFGSQFDIMLVLLVGSMAGMFAVRGLRKRSRILWAGIVVGLAKFLAIVCIGLINTMELNFYVKDGVWCIASGLLSGFIVMGLLPVYEHLFKVPTSISLLELSDLNHPLLKELALKAPGTYHHSILVGNLAEGACDAIGANSLLSRVGAYYHDIGKTPKAEYFSENELGSGSRHDKLSPSMSALIIAKHVKEGVEIAKKHKLNKAIIDFITQHHGDSLIAYFYQRAIERSEKGTVLDEENFRYPGPKPQTKESAIILMADSVEASSRALREPTPASIKNLVKKIVNNKFIDGQLDECDLTLRDMHKIVDSFVRTLMGIFHTRLDYPEKSKKAAAGTSLDDSRDKYRKPKPREKS